MDGRGTLRLSVLLLLSAAGCQQQVVSVPNPGTLASANQPALPIDRSKIKPARPKTKDLPPLVWVSYGNFQAGEAAADGVPPDRQQQFRDAARTDYEEALKIDKKCVPAYQGLARLYQAGHEPSLAIETYHKALKIAPKDASLWYELGMCHHAQKTWDSALHCLDRAVQLDSRNRTYTNAMGVVLAEAGRYDESLSCFIRSSGEAQGYYRLARTLQRLQQPEMSQRYLAVALEKDPRLADSLAQQDGRSATPNPSAPPVQPTSYQDDSETPPHEEPRVLRVETSHTANAPVPPPLLPPTPPVNMQYEQPNP